MHVCPIVMFLRHLATGANCEKLNIQEENLLLLRSCSFVAHEMRRSSELYFIDVSDVSLKIASIQTATNEKTIEL